MNWQAWAIIALWGLTLWSQIPGVWPGSINPWLAVAGTVGILLIPALTRQQGGQTGQAGGQPGANILQGVRNILARIWAFPFFLLAAAAGVFLIGLIWPGTQGQFWWNFRFMVPFAAAAIAFVGLGGASPGLVRTIAVVEMAIIGWHFWSESRFENQMNLTGGGSGGEVFIFRVTTGRIYPEKFDRLTLKAGETVEVTLEGDYTVQGAVPPGGTQPISGQMFLLGDYRYEFNGRPWGEVQVLAGTSPLQGVTVSGNEQQVKLVGVVPVDGKINLDFNGVSPQALDSGTVRGKVGSIGAAVVSRQSKIMSFAKKTADKFQEEIFTIRLLGEDTPSVDRIDLWNFAKRYPDHVIDWGNVPQAVRPHRTADGHYGYYTGPAGYIMTGRPVKKK